MNPSASALTFLPSNPNPNVFNPISNPQPDLSATLSSLNNLIHLSHHTFRSLPTLQPPLQTPNPNLLQCPFDPHHLMPPESLFLHSLRCASSPHPLPNPDDLLHSLSYPKTLQSSDHSLRDNSFVQTLLDPHTELCFSLNEYVDFGLNFFYRDCPGVVSLYDVDASKRTFTLPRILSIECADFTGGSRSEVKNCEREHVGILPSEYWAIRKEVEAWNDYPTTYSYGVLRAVLGVGYTKECDLMRWIIANSPRYGVVIDIAMQHHIFLLFSLCLKAIQREALNTMDLFLNNHNLELNWVRLSSECPILVQALTWLASQMSILYGATNGKLFVLNLIKICILDDASGLLFFSFGKNDTEAPLLNGKFQNSIINGRNIKDAKLDIRQEGNTIYGQNVDGTVRSPKVFVFQVVAAVAALHERSLLEDRIKRLWFSQQPNKYQLVAEHCYVTERANEERKKRPHYRPVVDYDGLPRQQSSNMESTKVKTREELLAEERDYKRRRMSYRGKKIKRSTVQVMRDIIEEYMEEIKQAGGIGSPVKESEESGMFMSKPHAGHDIDLGAKNLRKGRLDSPSIAASSRRHYEQQSHTNYSKKSKAIEFLEDTSPRDNELPRQGHYRNRGYVEDQWDTGRGNYSREHASRSPERPKSYSRSNESNSHHKNQDYSNRKKSDHKSRTRDRWKRNSHRSQDYDPPLKSAFRDRYDPSQSIDICEDDVSSDTKCQAR
ncbi:U11/U12 small nuclear ribonucleoprotein 48 kDa protein [Senna tora]|uniref:U11/U12 small nuclear ribonucleoprotein 48 kDa protein n=1 Tax=Senna tora TaxID=362788 RepID=A0A834SJA8_9FABA|nr:U11/U12 small nuclear ribonucleoprotein 48 kDa protein [Senna tora]